MAQDPSQDNSRDVIETLPIETLLENDSINARDLEALKNSGFHTVQSIAYSLKKQLVSIRGISDNKANLLLREAMRHCRMGFSSSLEYLTKEEDLIRITTGSKNLDEALGGGIDSGSITEFFGAFGTGKSQLCHTLAVTCQLKIEQGGGQGKCIYIDTEGTFRPNRLTEIGKRYNLDDNQVLANVSVAKCYNSDHQYDLLKEASALLSSDHYSLMIIDSVTNLFRTDYIGREQLASRQQHLARCLRLLQRMAEVYGIAVVVTNQVIARINDGASCSSANNNHDANTMPIGGNIIAHASTTRLWFKRSVGDKRLCRIVSSPYLPEVESEFTIRTNGICDKDTTNSNNNNSQD